MTTHHDPDAPLPDHLAELVTNVHRSRSLLAQSEHAHATISRVTVRTLLAAGYTTRTTAHLLGISHQRVSQLARD